MQCAARSVIQNGLGSRALIRAQCRNLWVDRRTKFEGLPEDQVRQEDGKTYRIRQHGNKKLPLPPMLDPEDHAARMRYTRLAQQRNQRDVSLTAFQGELASNPYAHALVTPIRQCKLTRALLPAHFLHRLHLECDNSTEPPLLRMVTPANDVQEPSSRKIESLYFLKHEDVFDEITKRGIRQFPIVALHATEQAAMLFEKSPKSFDIARHLELDKQMGKKIEKILVDNVQDLLEKVRTEHSDVCLDAAMAQERLSEVAAIVRMNADAESFEYMHDRPCYTLALPFDGEGIAQLQPSDETDSPGTAIETLALIKHKITVPVLLALDALFMFKKLYPEPTGRGRTMDRAWRRSEYARRNSRPDYPVSSVTPSLNEAG